MQAYVRGGIAGGAEGRIERDPQFQLMDWGKLQLGRLLRY